MKHIHNSIDFDNFSKGLQSFNPKGLYYPYTCTHIHDLVAYVKEGLSFAWDLSLENSVDSYLFSTSFTSVSYFFFLYESPSLSLCTVFDSFSSNIDEVLLINPSANEFVFGDMNVHHKDWLTYSGGTDKPGEL